MSLSQWALGFVAGRPPPVARRRTRSALHAALSYILVGCAASGRSVYLFGPDSQTLYSLRDRSETAFPGLHVAGMCDAAFDGSVDAAILADIGSRQPDLLIADMSAGILQHVAAGASRLVPGIRIVSLRRGFAAAGPGARAAAWLAGQLPAAARRPLSRGWRSVTVHLRFAGLVIRQKLGLALH